MNELLTVVTSRTPRGNVARFATRDSTSDAALVSGIIGEDEYDLKDLSDLTGWAIDIGAHIGTVSVVLALDHPDLRIVAVEALPENVEMVRRNVELNGLGDRVFVEEAAAGGGSGELIPITYGWSHAENQPDAYMADNRFVGGMLGPNDSSTTVLVRGLRLVAILHDYKITAVELLKIDCEGCEWRFLRDPAIASCKRIWGEYHEAMDPANTYAELLRLLEPTHEVKHIRGDNVGIFRATRRDRYVPTTNAWAP